MGDTIVVTQAPTENFLEQWRFVGRGKLIIRRIGEFGRQHSSRVQGGMTFHVTAAERRLNQQAVAKPEYDPFTNGQCEAILLDPSDPDYEKLTTNPNVIREDDISRAFRLKGEKFRERLSHISSAASIRRLIELAEADNSDVTVPQWRALQARLAELDTELQHVSLQVQQAMERGEDPEIDGTSLPKPVQLGR